MTNPGLFLMLHPQTKWMTSKAILALHAVAIEHGLCLVNSHTEDLSKAMTALEDCGMCAFEHN